MVASCCHWGRLPTGLIQLDDCSVDYWESGSGSPVLVIPGLAGGVGLVEPLIDVLSKKYRVVACQLRGESWSFCERPFTFEQLIADLDRVIQVLRLERPGIVGVSFGGAIALEYAARRPGAASFLAVQGAGTRYQPGLLGDLVRAVLGRLSLPDDNPVINQLFRVLAAGKKKDREQLKFIVERCWKTDQSVMAQRLALLDDYDISERLEAVRTPTLVAFGEDDVLLPAREAQTLAERLPQARLKTISKAGHLAFVTHPEVLGRAIASFDREMQIA